jgi:NAD(P)H-dependent FMN reductase
MQITMLTISVIVGSTRQNRFSEIPAAWIHEHLKSHDDVDARLLDLQDYPMPFFDQPMSPANPNHVFEDENVRRWTAEIGASDGFVFVTAEYNYAPPAVLKNALDWVYGEWNRKAAAFLSHGSAGGVRAAQQLREIAVELQLAPVRATVALPKDVQMAYRQGGDFRAELEKHDDRANLMIDDLIWWTRALKEARERDAEAAAAS